VLLPLVLFAHLLVFFAGQWSLAVRCAVSLAPAEALADASLARVQPAPNAGSEALVALEFNHDDALFPADAPFAAPCCPVAGPGGAPLTLAPFAATFAFQHATYFASEPGQAHLGASCRVGVAAGWRRVTYPTDSPLSAYLSCGGYQTPAQVEAGAARWGNNAVEIPMPLFGDLMAEHAVAPMFVFQMVCVGLWCLDEYWYYSIFTLVMLVIFESTVRTIPNPASLL
jgi:cation-transporting ATPase 13A1